MPQLSLNFLGTVQVILNKNLISRFRTNKNQGLLVYLAMHSQLAIPRSKLATLFWPDADESKSKRNLRQAIYQIRQLLKDDSDSPHPFLLINSQTIQFNPDSDTSLDVQLFLNEMEHGNLAKAVSYYHGELLAGYTCDSLEFEDWLRLERERLHRLAVTTLDDLTERQIIQEDYDTAQITARRQLELEPWRESAHRQLMRIFALSGDRSAALAQYLLCQQVLEQELGAPPSSETDSLASRIQDNAFGNNDDTLIAGQYEMGSQIGQGAMGTVYRGRDTYSGQPVAIKMLDRNRVVNNPELVQRFKREAEVLRQLSHPNIVQLLATDEKEGHHYLVMDYIEGGDLYHFLKKNPRPSLKETLTIALDIADALTRSHHLHILHRDIKPANILLDTNNRPLLTDFGLARLSEESTVTQQGGLMGTVAYISPEGCLGESLDERADIWAFGLLIYEMLAGKRAFSKPTSAATLIAILQEPIPDLRSIRQDLPNALSDLLMQMLAKDKNDRIVSIRSVGATLEAILNSLETEKPFDIVTGEPDSQPVSAAPDPQPVSATPNLQPVSTTPASETMQPLTAQSIPFLAAQAPPHFVGRESLLSELENLVASQKVIALVGMGGIGKTSLASVLAHQLRTIYPDGVLWANTRNSETSNIFEMWARAYGYDISGLTDVASRKTAVRGLLSDKQTLIILDNVDDAADARSLMLAGEQGAILLTTRNQDIASTLNAYIVPVPELLPNGSQALLVNILGEARVLADAEETAAALQIGELLNHLPLAVEIVAQRLKSRPRMRLVAMAERLQSTQRRLGLEISDQAVRASFQVSWDALDKSLQHLFAQMAVFAGRPFTLEALAATANLDLLDTEDDLYTLTALSLTQEIGESHYRQHLLLADFAAEKLGDLSTTQQRMAAYYLTFAQAFKAQFEQLDPEWENINAAIQAAFDLEAWQMVLEFTDALTKSWIRYGRYSDANHAYALAQTAANNLQADDQLAQTLLRSAEIGVEQSNYDQAWQQLQQSLQLYYELEDDQGIAKTQFLQGFILYDQGEYQQAEKHLQQSQELQASLSDKKAEARAIGLLARVYYETETSLEKAEKTAFQALDLLEPTDASEAAISILKIIATIEIRKSNFKLAEQYATQALEYSQAINKPAEIGATTRLLVIIYRKQQKYTLAEQLAQTCLNQFQQLGNRRLEGMILNELALIYLATDKLEQAQQATEKTLTIYRQIEDRLGYGYALLDLGDIYMKLEMHQKASEVWQEAQQLAIFLEHSFLQEELQQRLNDLKE